MAVGCSVCCRRFVARWILICVHFERCTLGADLIRYYYGEQKCVDAEGLRAGGEDSDLI